MTASGGVAVYVNANGQLGTLTSSRRFKRDIQDLGSVSDRLMRLRPVRFRYNDAAEHGPHAVQYGLIAEEVAKVYPNLVQYDKNGKPFTVYYHLLTPMLLNELQKAHRGIEAQRTEIIAMKAAHTAEIAAQNSKIAAQQTRIVALNAVLQRQSVELASLKQAQEQQNKVLATLKVRPKRSSSAAITSRLSILAISMSVLALCVNVRWITFNSLRFPFGLGILQQLGNVRIH